MPLTDKDFTDISSRPDTILGQDGAILRTIRTSFKFRGHGPFTVHTARDDFSAEDQNKHIVSIGERLDKILALYPNVTEFQQITSTRKELLGVQTLNTEFALPDGSKFSVEVPFQDFTPEAVNIKLNAFLDMLDKLQRPLGR